jgi:ADP-ribose pyrophosphatase
MSIAVAAGIIWTPNERLIISQRAKNQPLAGMWQFPGGKVERGETLSVALKRELLEELGITVELVGLAYHHIVDLPHGIFELYYLHCVWLPEGGCPKALAETSDWTIAAVDELHGYTFARSDREVATCLEKVGLTFYWSTYGFGSGNIQR